MIAHTAPGPMSDSARTPASAATTDIEAAFVRLRSQQGVRAGFPADVLHEAEEAARRSVGAGPERADRTALPMVTVDPPGSRDLDQALCFERSGEGLLVWYAIADVGFFVDRGSAIEREAWFRGLTFYAPDHREPLYPPVLGHGAASLLPEVDRPAILFRLDLDARGEIRSAAVERARVRSRAQLTYAEALEHIEGGGERFRGEEWSESLLLLREFGELRKAREIHRGGISLPLVEQHVQQDAAAVLGYELAFEDRNVAEDWNAQVSLLTGHAAALQMLEAGVGLLRTVPPIKPESVAALRVAARALGFEWPEGMEYGAFLRSLDLEHPAITPLLWQARRVNQGADYVAFEGEPPANPLHAALAMPYAHVTAPLRRLADRYVLDLLVQLSQGSRPSPEEFATLARLPAVMDEAERKAGRVERGVVDIAEASILQGREGATFPATLLAVRDGRLEVQIEEPPIRATASRNGDGPRLEIGAPLQVRLTRADVAEGKAEFEWVE